MIRWVSYQTMLGVMIQAPFAIGNLQFYISLFKLLAPIQNELKSELMYSILNTYDQIFRFSSGMSLLTVIAMFTPNWSNLQLIGSAITFIQVGIYRLWGAHVGLGP